MSPKLELEFIKRLLTDTVYNEEIKNDYFINRILPTPKQIVDIILSPIDPIRIEGMDWPDKAHTMIGFKRLNNLHANMDYIRDNNVEGDLIETGVWRGGASIFMQYYNKLYKLNKKLFVADSFEGLPKPDAVKYPVDKDDKHYKENFLKVSLEEVKENFKLYDCLNDNVVFLKGWFKDTLNNEEIGKLSLLRFDGDMYGSTMDVLENLYTKINRGGILVIDDYGLPNCCLAISDFRLKYNISEPIEVIDNYGIYWYKK